MDPDNTNKKEIDMTETVRRGRERLSLEQAMDQAPEVTKEVIIEVVKKAAKSTTKDTLIDALAAVIAQPVARVRLFESEELAKIEERVQEEKLKQKKLDLIEKMRELGMTGEDIKAAGL